MNETQLGAVFRAVRIHRIERGHIGTLPLRIVRAVAAVLEIRLELVVSWRGGSLDHVMNARHSALHERLANRLVDEPGWVSAAEVSYSIWGERGVIDRLAFHAERRMLAVFEIKADLSDPAGLIAQIDRYRRLAPEIGRGHGWEADSVGCWAVVADTDTNRRRVAGHRELLRGAFPEGGRTFGGWLRDPAQRVDGLMFLAYPHARTSTRSLSTVKRVRSTRTS